METQVEARATRRLFTADEFHKMAEAGILHEDDRIELIEGELIEMAAIGTRHFACVNTLTRLLVRTVGDAAIVSVQNPVALRSDSEPQPDLVVLEGKDYRDALPGPEDVLLLIEVSDTTLRYDRETKLPLYARSGVREAWIVDLNNGAVERHTEPFESGYRHVRRAGKRGSLASEVLPEITLKVDDLVG
ncbi:Uma2 family endonuclease [Rubrobacter marinus]|uniref:Uma2 family endonuclease n=1 Tax=Rubrobacter marinus TaxID=2653852 RepID=A0A6G8PZ21_9ACTN|nr:Uma2 family endonuclease [Rubrobacter marinus]QIN79442.1 Uma2 family endonuclease [Rubrobacter marinus]